MRKIRVFYLVYGLTSGGIEKYSINLLKYINREKYDFDFIVKLDEEEFFDNILYALGGKKIPLSKGCNGNIIQRKVKYLKNLICVAKNSYDIGYFNLSSPSAVFKYPLICKLVGIRKIIIHSHNSYEKNIGVLKKILNYFGRIYINKISNERFACSDKAAEWMFGKRVKTEKRYKLIANGLELDQYIYNKEIRAKLRKKHGYIEKQLIIGHVGRFEDQKNHKFLIDIFVEILKMDKNSALVLIGIGKLEEKIKKRVHELGIDKNVLFLGERDNVNEYMQLMDIFLLPSLYEGLPIVGIEAQAAGLKCFFSDTISRESDVTGNVEFLDLNESPHIWAMKIKKYSSYNRISQKDKIEKAGFDIISTVYQVEKALDNLSES